MSVMLTYWMTDPVYVMREASVNRPVVLLLAVLETAMTVEKWHS